MDQGLNPFATCCQRKSRTSGVPSAGPGEENFHCDSGLTKSWPQCREYTVGNGFTESKCKELR